MVLVGATAMGLKPSPRVTQRSRSIAVQWISRSSRPLNGYEIRKKRADVRQETPWHYLLSTKQFCR